MEIVTGEDLEKVPLGEDEFISRDKELGMDNVIDVAETEFDRSKLSITKVPDMLNNINKITKPGRRANGRIEPLALKSCLLFCNFLLNL